MVGQAMSRSLRELYESSPFSSVQVPYVEGSRSDSLKIP